MIMKRFVVRCNYALKKGSARWFVVDKTTGVKVERGDYHFSRKDAEEEAREFNKEDKLESKGK
jgi:hypothetical protein